ncbi:ABC transporter ATP-binding protein [Nitratireductor thuwali]|uniref:Siderophore transport system ATP-binding protein YusV n=1 Tax=Nitratireductor thuwali TaxID=2267699 RepID=A0ABY5MPA4_9HYPH|nr:putative siderophore transport system ATP-binding protein YusV [Nitratireductor thuwali]
MLERTLTGLRNGLELRGAAAGYGSRLVFEGLDLAIASGRVTALCGPNGCGKSTMLRAMRAMLPLSAGAALVDGGPVDALPVRERARRIAMLSQNPSAPDEMTVEDLVRLGRYAHRKRFAPAGPDDRQAADAAMAAAGVADIAARPIGQLSGGQLQRAWIAMVIAQAAPVILLDEPTNHLDIAHALETLDLVARLCHREARTVAVVLHDLNLAARHADDIVFLRQGRIVAQGPVAQTFTRDVISSVFGIECRVLSDEETGRPFCIPVRATGHG